MDSKPKSFLARWLKGAMQPDLSADREQQPEANPENTTTLGQFLPHSILVFTPEQDASFSPEQKAQYNGYLSQLPPLKVGEINFTPFEVGLHEGGYYARVFIRYARDLEQEFTLDPLPLSLYDDNYELVAKGVFAPQGFGTLRFGETRVWTFYWNEELVVKRDPDFSGFAIRFE